MFNSCSHQGFRAISGFSGIYAHRSRRYDLELVAPDGSHMTCPRITARNVVGSTQMSQQMTSVTRGRRTPELIRERIRE
jgi:hypothetical protein